MEPAPAGANLRNSTSNNNNGKPSRLQIRLPDGKRLIHTFDGSDTLNAVDRYIRANGGPGLLPGRYQLMTNMPTRIFTDEDEKKTLDELGLTPSAVVIVTLRDPKGGDAGSQWFQTSVPTQLKADTLKEIEDQKRKEAYQKKMKELEKAKAEQEKHLEKLKQQIDGDKAERKHKFKYTPEHIVVETTRLQINLPNNSIIIHEFPVLDPLSVVRSFIANNLPQYGYGRSSKFQLVLGESYPKRVYTHVDMNKTLKDLGLDKGATLIVAPS